MTILDVESQGSTSRLPSMDFVNVRVVTAVICFRSSHASRLLPEHKRTLHRRATDCTLHSMRASLSSPPRSSTTANIRTHDQILHRDAYQVSTELAASHTLDISFTLLRRILHPRGECYRLQKKSCPLQASSPAKLLIKNLKPSSSGFSLSTTESQIFGMSVCWKQTRKNDDGRTTTHSGSTCRSSSSSGRRAD